MYKGVALDTGEQQKNSPAAKVYLSLSSRVQFSENINIQGNFQ